METSMGRHGAWNGGPARAWIMAMVVTGLLATLFAGCNEGSSEGMTTGAQAREGNLRGFASEEELTNYLKKGMLTNVESSLYRQDVMYEAAPTADNAMAGASGGNHSRTNVQEAGVDEADTVKTDGRHLYIAPANQYGPYFMNEVADAAITVDTGVKSASDAIRVMSLSEDPASATEVSRISVAELKNRISGMYLLTEREAGRPDLLVTVGGEGQDIWGMWYCPWCWRTGQVEVVLFDVSAPRNPSRLTRIVIDGRLIASRRVGEILYLVTRHTPQVADFDPYAADDPDRAAANEKRLETVGLKDLLPGVSVDGAAAGSLVTARDCYLPPYDDTREPDPTLVTVTAIDLSNPGAAEGRVSRSIIGPCETVYVSTASLWLATTRFGYAPPFRGDVAGMPEEAPPDTTDLHKFSLTAAGPEYRGSGEVIGNLGWQPDKRPFRMSEVNGVLRVATSLGDSWNATSSTRLALLREDGNGRLTETAHIDHIGETGEQLYAIRYVGNRAYLVTFRVTDPLYVFDLSDPDHPALLGELHIPGYSDYLHPVSEDLLLGIGKDAVPAEESDDFGGRGAWYQGLKLSLFDVSDPASPREIAGQVIGKRGTESDALWDHHALAWLPPSDGLPGRLALPVRLHDRADPYVGWDGSQPNAYYGWTHTGLYLFAVGETGLTLQGRMITESATTTGETWTDATDRAVLLGNSAHYVHGGRAWSSPWPTSPSGNLIVIGPN